MENATPSCRSVNCSGRYSTAVIPSEVEESLTISVLDLLVSTEISRDVSTLLDMTKAL